MHSDVRERKKNLLRYTPDVARAIAAVLNGVNKRKRLLAGEVVEEDDGGGRGKQQMRAKDEKQAKLYEEIERKWTAAAGAASSSSSSSSSQTWALDLVQQAGDMPVFDKKLRSNLESAIEKVDLESALEAAAIDRNGKGGPAAKEALFVAPLDAETRFTTPVTNSVCSIRFFSSAVVQ